MKPTTVVVFGDGQRFKLGELFSYKSLGQGADYHYFMLESTADCRCPRSYDAYNRRRISMYQLMDALGPQGMREVLGDPDALFLDAD